MKCGKLTAKLRDAVPVRFYENGREVKRYKNIEIPDTVKELEFQNFKFDVPLNGAITFKIFFEQGILPEVWPEARLRRIRAKKDEPSIPETKPAPAEDANAQDGVEMPQDAADPGKKESVYEDTETSDNADNAPMVKTAKETEDAPPESMEIRFDVSGSARKALAGAIGEHAGAYPAYQAAPSFAYLIGDYTLDRNGTLAGSKNDYLIRSLTEDGYQIK